MSHEQDAIEPLEIEACWFRADVTTLTGALDASTDTVSVDDASLIQVGDTLAIDDELLDVEAVSGDTLTVDRATDETTAATHADTTTVGVFTRRRFKLMQELRQQALDRFAGKITIGAFDRDSNDTLSAWILGDLTGGHGIAELQEGTTDTRYRFGTLYTRYANQWTKPFSITETTLGANRVTPLGDLVWDEVVYRMTASNATLYQDTTNRGSLSTNAWDRGVPFSGTASVARFYIPRSAAGYSTFNPATNTLTNVTGAEEIRGLVVWNDLLIAVEQEGTMLYATTAADTTTFTPYTLGGNPVKLQAGTRPARMHIFYDRQSNPVPFLVTNEAVFAFDPDTPRLYRIPDFESVHPRFGYASAVWRGELYVSSGLDIMAFNGEVLRFTTSLGRDDGLPYAYGAGYIRDLVAGQNALYALVRGQTTGGVTHTSVHEWSGFGWHCVWAGSHASPPRGMAMSAADVGYSLHWGLDGAGALYTQTIPESFTNPREAITTGDDLMGDFTVTSTIDGTAYYTQTYYLESGEFNANMTGYRKIAHGVELDIRSLASGYETVRMWYRIDFDTAWTQLGPDITTHGHHLHQFGPLDPNGFRVGLDFEDIELRVTVTDRIPVTGYVQATSAVIESAVFSFHKRMHPGLAWTADIDASAEFRDASAAQQVADLTELRTLKRFFSVRHGTRQARAVITGQSGNVAGGWDPGGRFQISLLEISEQLGV